MPRYFFNTPGGGRQADVEGSILPHDAAARKHAIIFAGDILLGEPDAEWENGEFVVEVWDAQGFLLFSVVSVVVGATDWAIKPREQRR